MHNFVKIRSKKIIPYCGKVYDLQVSTVDGTYNVQDVTTHNSAAGSLLCYCLGITDVDPIKHKLFFERFLNEQRQDIPDIDIDFSPHGREDIKDYIQQYDNDFVRYSLKKELQFGVYDDDPDKSLLIEALNNNTPIPKKFNRTMSCSIGAYGSFQTKATLLDVCRTFGVSLDKARDISKQILNDVDEMTKEEILENKDYNRILTTLDSLNELDESFHARKNKKQLTISRTTILNSFADLPEDLQDKLWQHIIDIGVIDEEGHILTTSITKNDLELPFALQKYLPRVLSVLNHLQYVTPLGAIWHIRDRKKNASKHAAGVIISSVDLRTNLPLMTTQGKVISSWIEGKSGSELSLFGFIKLDILGLANLVYIDETIKLIKSRYADKKQILLPDGTTKIINIDNITTSFIDTQFDDPLIYQYMREGKTALIFQFESPMMRKLLSDSYCDGFECLVALNALGRPGPIQSGMTEEYCQRKTGQKEYTIHPVLEDSLGSTYGVVCFQEQIMAVVNKLAGYSLAETDNFRKVLIKAKKDIQDENYRKLQVYKEKFVEGGQKYMTVAELEELFDGFQKWAGYGFNRCLSGDTVVIQFDGKKQVQVTIDHLDTNKKTSLMSMKKGHIKRDILKDVFYTGKQNVYKISTAQLSIKATANHKFLGADGWTQVSDFEVGDIIAISNGMNTEVEYASIKNIEYAGYMDTYDIEMVGREHNFIANGFVSHNSHAVSYTVVSFRCAWLKTYFPLEYITTVLSNTTKGDVLKSGKRSNKYAEYIAEAKRLEINILPPDINKSKENFTIESDDTIRIGLSNIKGVGLDKARTIVAQQPYISFTDFINKSKMTKTVVYNLLLVNVFSDLNNMSMHPFEAMLLYFRDKKIDILKEYKRLKQQDDDSARKINSLINQLLKYVSEDDEKAYIEFIKTSRKKDDTKQKELSDEYIEDNMNIGTLPYMVLTHKLQTTNFHTKLNYGRVSFEPHIEHELINKGYLKNNKITFKFQYNNTNFNLDDIKLTEQEKYQVFQAITKVDSTKLELSHRDLKEFFFERFGFALEHFMQNELVVRSIDVFKEKLEKILVVHNAYISISTIQSINSKGCGMGVGHVVDFYEKTSLNGSQYGVVEIEDGFGEENRLIVYVWENWLNIYTKLLDIRDHKRNKIKHKNRLVFFNVIKEEGFNFFTPLGFPTFEKFELIGEVEEKDEEMDFTGSLKRFIQGISILNTRRLKYNNRSSIVDIIGYGKNLIEDNDEDSGTYKYLEEGDNEFYKVNGIDLETTTKLVAPVVSISQEKIAKSKKTKWIDIVLGDLTGSLILKVWGNNSDGVYENVQKLKPGQIIIATIRRTKDYQRFSRYKDEPIINKSFVLDGFERDRVVLNMFFKYRKKYEENNNNKEYKNNEESIPIRKA